MSPASHTPPLPPPTSPRTAGFRLCATECGGDDGVVQVRATWIRLNCVALRLEVGRENRFLAHDNVPHEESRRLFAGPSSSVLECAAYCHCNGIKVYYDISFGEKDVERERVFVVGEYLTRYLISVALVSVQ